QGAELIHVYTMSRPSNVGMQRVYMLVRFEDGWAALEAADALDPEAIGGLSRERQAGHQVTMARTSLLTRRKEDAATALVEADRLAPEDVRGRADTVSLVKAVAGAMARPPADLRALAERCGLRA